MSLFTDFPTTEYTFLELSTGGVLGNAIASQHIAQGIFKERDGMTATENRETVQSDATLHIKPSESFLATVGHNTVGHGISESKNGSTQEYRIVGQTEGYDFGTNTLEFYRLTLRRESLAEYGS